MDDDLMALMTQLAVAWVPEGCSIHSLAAVPRRWARGVLLCVVSIQGFELCGFCSGF